MGSAVGAGSEGGVGAAGGAGSEGGAILTSRAAGVVGFTLSSHCTEERDRKLACLKQGIQDLESTAVVKMLARQA